MSTNTLSVNLNEEEKTIEVFGDRKLVLFLNEGIVVGDVDGFLHIYQKDMNLENILSMIVEAARVTPSTSDFVKNQVTVYMTHLGWL
jgi:hypothetical protein